MNDDEPSAEPCHWHEERKMIDIFCYVAVAFRASRSQRAVKCRRVDLLKVGIRLLFDFESHSVEELSDVTSV